MYGVSRKLWPSKSIIYPTVTLPPLKHFSGDLSSHSWLAALLVVNVIGTAVAIALVLRGYLHSKQ